jgi:hypothetical protein
MKRDPDQPPLFLYKFMKIHQILQAGSIRKNGKIIATSTD